jgi:hypothetical protein
MIDQDLKQLNRFLQNVYNGLKKTKKPQDKPAVKSLMHFSTRGQYVQLSVFDYGCYCSQLVTVHSPELRTSCAVLGSEQ